MSTVVLKTAVSVSTAFWTGVCVCWQAFETCGGVGRATQVLALVDVPTCMAGA